MWEAHAVEQILVKSHVNAVLPNNSSRQRVLNVVTLAVHEESDEIVTNVHVHLILGLILEIFEVVYEANELVEGQR